MNSDQITQLASADVQAFLFAHENTDETTWLLQGRPVAGMPPALMAQQVAARRKAREKLPLFYQSPGIVYPAPLNLEQTSSEAAARFKATAIGRALGAKVPAAADLTGGWGVDSLFLSAWADNFFYAEPDSALVRLASHNHRLLQQSNITYVCEALPGSLASVPNDLGFVFLDPSRRGTHRKTVQLDAYVPAVVPLLPLLWQKTALVVLKTSPLLDIQRAQTQLSYVRQVHVVAVKNECKELLFLCDKNHRGSPALTATTLHSNWPDFSFTPEEERRATAAFSPPLAYLYEPAAAILKAGAFKLAGQRYGLKKLHPNTHLYTSEEVVPAFPGRIFEINPAARAARLPGGCANVLVRNFPASADALRQKLGLADGGDQYVLAFTGPQTRHVVVARRLS